MRRREFGEPFAEPYGVSGPALTLMGRKLGCMSIPEPHDLEPEWMVLPPDEALRVAKPVPPHPPAEPGDPTPEDWERLEEVLGSGT